MVEGGKERTIRWSTVLIPVLVGFAESVNAGIVMRHMLYLWDGLNKCGIIYATEYMQRILALQRFRDIAIFACFNRTSKY